MAEQTSWRNPGRVSSAVRVPPPTVSRPSTTSTERPAAARVDRGRQAVRAPLRRRRRRSGHRAVLGAGFLQRSPHQHLGQVDAELDAGVEVGLGRGVGRGLLGRVGRRRAAGERGGLTAAASTGVEPMLTSATPLSPLLRHAATPTMAQSWARRLNFWKLQPALPILGMRISVSSSSAARVDSEEALVEVGRGDLPRPVRALGHVRRRRARAWSPAGRRPGRRGPASHRWCPGGAPAGSPTWDVAWPSSGACCLTRSDVSTSRWRVSAPMARWSPPSRMYDRSVSRPMSTSTAGEASRSFMSGRRL